MSFVHLFLLILGPNYSAASAPAASDCVKEVNPGAQVDAINMKSCTFDATHLSSCKQFRWSVLHAAHSERGALVLQAFLLKHVLSAAGISE